LYTKANLEGFRNHILGKFAEWVSSTATINDRWNSFKAILFEARELYVPSKLVKHNSDPIYFNMHVRNLKARCRREYNKHTSSSNKYKSLRAELNKGKSNAYEQYIIKICNSNKNDCWKQFYSHLKSMKRSCTGIPALVASEDGSTVITSKEKADALNNNYGLTFTPNTLIQPTCPYVTNSQPQDAKLFKISRKLIVKAISKLKNHSVCDPDDISSKLLKLVSVQILLYLENIYQICLNNSVMPKEWKQAIVIPIFKCGQRSKPAN
jgi:hypothetical protein